MTGSAYAVNLAVRPQFTGTGIGIDGYVVQRDGCSLCLCQVPFVGPDGVGTSSRGFPHACINNHDLIYNPVTIPVIVAEIYLIVNSATSSNDHLARMNIEVIWTGVLTIVTIFFPNINRSYHVKCEVEQSTALVEEVVMDTASESIWGGKPFFVGKALIEREVICLSE